MKSNEDSIYNAIIIALVIGIIIVIITLIYFRPEPETFTELYFNDHQDLPKYSQNEYNFSFTIANHENKDFEYTYRINIDDIVIEENKVFIKNKENKTIEKTIQFNIEDKSKIQVQVSTPKELLEIHFWVKNSYKYYPYDEFDGKIDCLNKYEKGLLLIKAHGNNADGYPILEVFFNGKKVNEYSVNETNYYNLEIPENTIVDLRFNNDYYLKNETIIDRNLVIEELKLNNIDIKPVYDTGKDEKAFNCEDLRNTLRMNSNGALRFRT